MFSQFIGASHTVLFSSAVKQTLSSQTINILVHGPYMKPPPPLGIFEDSDFWTPCYMTIQYLLVCPQNIGA